jgi:hypothetical protein
MGRRPLYSRAQRIERGLPVCPVDDCPRAPCSSNHCKVHYREADIPRRRPGEVSATLVVDVRADLVRAVKLEAQRRGVYPARVVEEALEPVVRSWGLTP